MNIAIACGGTGGHLFPGMAVGQALRSQGHHVVLWVSGRDVEKSGLARWGGATIEVPAQGFSEGGLKGKAATVWALLRAVRTARVQMRRNVPDVLLAMGSYASVGPVLAAWSLRVPIVLHEANAVPGKAIRFLARFAREVCTTFEVTAAHFPKRPTRQTGLPIHFDPIEDGAAGAKSPEMLSVLVSGGSQGAAALNAVVPAALASLAAEGYRFSVVHLAGHAKDQAVRCAYEGAAFDVEVQAFSTRMAQEYRRADVAICRAGASTSCEIAFYGVPAIMVPHPTAGGGHQIENARELERLGGAVMMEQHVLTAESIREALRGLLDDENRRARMRTALKSFARPDAADKVAERVVHHAA